MSLTSYRYWIDLRVLELGEVRLDIGKSLIRLRNQSEALLSLALNFLTNQMPRGKSGYLHLTYLQYLT